MVISFSSDDDKVDGVAGRLYMMLLSLCLS